MGKFQTTNSNLFNNTNKSQVPDWMQNLVDNLEIKDRQFVELDVEKRGIFAEKQQVYRPDVIADPRGLEQNFNESKLLADSKIELAKFLIGKRYKIANSNIGVNYITLDVKLDSINAEFQFPFEVKSNKLVRTSSFYANGGEYPFSKPGLEESISDIKSGRTKTSSTKAESFGKAYLINREEIIRRFNGSLREATDRINQLLTEGSIIGAGSNTYASVYDVEQLFPQMQKEGSQERIAEFHFAPNTEHVTTNQNKSSNLLSIEASKLLGDHFEDFKILSSVRDNNELLVKATVLNQKGLRTNVDFSFAINNEKVETIKIAEINNNRMTVNQLLDYLGYSENSALNKYLLDKKASKHIYSGIVLTKKDIKSKLFKIVESSKVDGIINNWIYDGKINPVNSTTYTTEYSFEELLASTDIQTLSDEKIKEIESSERFFGEGLDIDTSVQKPEDKIRDVEDYASEEVRLVNANNFISKHLKQFRLASFEQKGKDYYVTNIEFINKNAGTRHNIPFNLKFEGSKVIECTAFVGDHEVSLENLKNAFYNNKVLARYLQDKSNNLTAGPIVMSLENMKRKLSSVITASKIDSVIDKWIANGSLTHIGGNNVASENSFEELLSNVDDSDIITDEEVKVAEYQKDYFGKQIKIKTDDITEDTGVREAEDVWSAERKQLIASSELSKMFKQFAITASKEDESFYYVNALVKNPITGLNSVYTFKFEASNGKISNLVTVAKGQQEVEINKIIELFEQDSNDVGKHFATHNKIVNRNYDVLISKANLENKLKTVASIDKIDSIIKDFIKMNYMQPINSVTYASKYSIAELINVNPELFNLDAGKEQINLSSRDEHKISVGESKIVDSNSRKLESKERELTPDMIKARDKIIQAIDRALNVKKITTNKSKMLLESLDKSKTSRDLEEVVKELNRYL